MSVQPKPEGYHTATPYLVVQGAKEAIEFYKKAFGAEELLKLETPDGSIAHAEFRIGDSPIMIGEEMKEMGFVSPTTLGGTAASIMLYVDDCDAMFQQAIDAGGTVIRAVSDQFYGDRNGMLADPFGHRWTVSTHVEDLSDEQIDERFANWMKEQGG